MPDRELARTHNGKNGHGFRSAVYTGTPALPEQQEDGRDQCSRVTDTDPPDEVGDIPAPADGPVKVPLADAIPHLRVYGYYPDGQTDNRDNESDPPQPGRTGLNRADKIRCNLVIIIHGLGC